MKKISNFDGINRYYQKKDLIKNIIKLLQLVGIFIITILAIDLMFFCMWIISGQYPTDGFYAGSITTNIIKTIIK